MDSPSLLRHAHRSFHQDLKPKASEKEGSRWFLLQPKHLWLLALLVVTGLRFFMAWVIPISPEEAYHWNFARHLDWSYYDHPPMLGWAIAAGRLVFGDTELGVRLVPVLFSIGSAVLLASLARRFYGEMGAFWTVVLLALNPCVLVVGGWGFPDAPLLFFWSLTLVQVWRALETDRGIWWLGAGAALGAGMLSKYTAAFIVPSVFFYLLFTRQYRRWLASPWPYLGGVAALIVFTPVVYWNWIHDWASFRFQSTARLSAANDFSWRAGGVFLGEQWLAILPLTLPLAIAVLWQALRYRRADERFLFWMFLPMIAFFWAFGFTPSYHVLWALPAYLSLTVLMAGAMVRAETSIARLYRDHMKWVGATAALVLAFGVTHAAWVIPGISPLRETYGWEEVAAHAKSNCESLSATGVNGSGVFYLAIGNRSYPCPSQLAFHLNEPKNVHGTSLLGIRNLQYQFWSNPEHLLGQDAVVVLESGRNDEWMRRYVAEHFRTVESAGELLLPMGKLPCGRKRQKRFLFYRAYGYLGLTDGE
jgi:dolichol-phosphate mannosyltransferase